MSNIVIAEPNDISDIVYHSVTEREMIADIASGAIAFPAAGKNTILLYGDYGTGKTTLARLLPAAIELGKGGNSAPYDFFRCMQGMNATDMIQKINRGCMLQSFNHSDYHYLVLDEIDNLTALAQKSLKSVMNLPHTIFVLTTNFINRIDEGVRSRSICVNSSAGPAADYLPIAKQVLIACGGKAANDEKLLPIIDACKGSVRDITEQMQRLATLQKKKAAIQ